MEQKPEQVVAEFLSHDEWTRAKTATIHFFQQRSLPDCQIHAVTFDNEEGQEQHWLCTVAQDEHNLWSLQSAGPLVEAIDSPTRNSPGLT